MGYTTWFDGSLSFNKPVTEQLKEYINRFSATRRMKRDNQKIKELFPNWKDLCFNDYLGHDGGYFTVDTGYYGQNRDESIIEYNHPPYGQPGLWCQWIINDNNELEWDGGEKFYNYVEWLEYLIEHFFKPLGYVLNGDITWEGEESDDLGTIHVVDNDVNVAYGEHLYSISDLSTNALIAELKARGYAVSEAV